MVMSNKLSISSNEEYARVWQVDVQQAFRRLANEPATKAEPVMPSREVNLNSIFDRLSQVSDSSSLDSSEQQNLSIQLRDMALAYREDTFRLQLDSHVVATAQQGLEGTQDVLAQMSQQIQEALTPPPLPPDLVHFSNQLQNQLNHFIDSLESIYAKSTFDSVAPFQSGEISVQVGLSAEQAVTIPLNFPAIADLRQQVKQLDSVSAFQGFQYSLAEQQQQSNSSQGQLAALASRLQIRGQFLSTAQERLLTAGLQLRHISEAQVTTQKVGQQIRRGRGGVSLSV